MAQTTKLTDRDRSRLADDLLPPLLKLSRRQKATRLKAILKKFQRKGKQAAVKEYLWSNKWMSDPPAKAVRNKKTGQFQSLDNTAGSQDVLDYCHKLKYTLPGRVCDKLYELSKEITDEKAVGLNNAKKHEKLRQRSKYVYDKGEFRFGDNLKAKTLFESKQLDEMFAATRREVVPIIAASCAGKKAARAFISSAARFNRRPPDASLNYYEAGPNQSANLGLAEHIDVNAVYGTFVCMLTKRQPKSVPGLVVSGTRIEHMLTKGAVVYFPPGIKHQVDCCGAKHSRGTLNYWF